MLSHQVRRQIEGASQKFWDQEIQDPFFVQMAQGTEIGHRIADHVSDKTTALLALRFTTTYQRNRQGDRVPRSMGDIWLLHSNIYHPINVKASIADNGGQPNMVSLKKLLAALLEYRIDSYYLLFVKIIRAEGKLEAKVHFVDMLDYLDYVTFDSGPGQIMLRSGAFFQAREQHPVPEDKPLSKKIDALVELLEDGERRLIRNRKASLRSFRTAVSRYDPSHHIVTPEAQAIFNLQ